LTFIFLLLLTLTLFLGFLKALESLFVFLQTNVRTSVVLTNSRNVLRDNSRKTDLVNVIIFPHVRIGGKG
jgi:hypothetical protein